MESGELAQSRPCIGVDTVTWRAGVLPPCLCLLFHKEDNSTALRDREEQSIVMSWGTGRTGGQCCGPAGSPASMDTSQEGPDTPPYPLLLGQEHGGVPKGAAPRNQRQAHLHREASDHDERDRESQKHQDMASGVRMCTRWSMPLPRPVDPKPRCLHRVRCSPEGLPPAMWTCTADLLPWENSCLRNFRNIHL